MPRIRLLALALASAALGSACYRVTVVSNAAPSPTVVDKPWVNYFVIGLVPPPQPISVAKECPSGVSKVVTERSFLNGLVSSLTWSLYTPIHVNVTCAGSGRASLGIPPEALGVAADARP
jgi:hypothetical protein